MKKKKIISYWNTYYNKKIKFKESSFARFVFKYIGKSKKNKLIDIGCGNGRDSVYFSKKGYLVTGIDISRTAIKNNTITKNKNLSFLKFDIENDTTSKKFDIIYSRFFLHALSEKGEKKLIQLINKIKTKNTYVFLEFRNSRDNIFYKVKNKKHNKFVNFNNGHFRRIIDTKLFIKNFISKTKSNNIYAKSSKNLSVIKDDNPNLSRVIFKF
jgi:2-polyprenyl-3-methyl-5-hydroxy-6-metoxy-1,4-benzoquinol methylase